MAIAFGVIAVLYAGLGVATIVAPGAAGSRVPLADLIELGFGQAGRGATAVLAVALTLGTVNVYTGSVCALAGALTSDGALPTWVTGPPKDDPDWVPRRPLLVLAVTGAVLLVALAAEVLTTTGVVRATSACFIAVYVLALGAAARILAGWMRVAAVGAALLAAVVAVFSAAYLLVPLGAAALCVVLRRRTTARREVRRA
jgi:amino acid efflux transporter